MTRPLPGEIRSTREALGLGIDWLAVHWGINEKTLRGWESGKTPCPDAFWDRLQELTNYTDDAIDDLIDRLETQTEPTVTIYHSDRPMREDMPDLIWPARWWRHVAYQAARLVPGTRIVSNRDTPREPFPYPQHDNHHRDRAHEHETGPDSADWLDEADNLKDHDYD